MSEDILHGDTGERAFGSPARAHPAGDAIHAVLMEMAEESPRCVMLCIYEDDTGYPMFHITDGTIPDPATFSSFMSQAHSAAEEAIDTRLSEPGCLCQKSMGRKRRGFIKHVMVETERFMMISRRIGSRSSLLLVLRSPVECLCMPVELLDRWEDKLSELVVGSGGLSAS